MAKIIVNPEAQLPERDGDAELSTEQLAALAVFSIKKAPSFDKFPGTHVLRRYKPGEVICYQGEPGRSAYYMLTAEDLKAIAAVTTAAEGETPPSKTPVDGKAPPVKTVAEQAVAEAPPAPAEPNANAAPPPRKKVDLAALRHPARPAGSSAASPAAPSSAETPTAAADVPPANAPAVIDPPSGEAEPTVEPPPAAPAPVRKKVDLAALRRPAARPAGGTAPAEAPPATSEAPAASDAAATSETPPASSAPVRKKIDLAALRRPAARPAGGETSTPVAESPAASSPSPEDAPAAPSPVRKKIDLAALKRPAARPAAGVAAPTAGEPNATSGPLPQEEMVGEGTGEVAVAAQSSPRKKIDLAALKRPAKPAAAAAETTEATPPRQVATARLVVDAPATAGRQPSFWSRLLRGQWGSAAKLAAPASIPIDGPSDIDYQTRTAPIFAGEVFGEMSCLTRQPRSATIVADEECYALEFLRNVLDQMLRDPQYKARSDAKYRERIMEGHLRSLSLFRHLSPEKFQQAAARIELVELAPGTALWDEGDAADAAYVVRSGLVKVVQNYPWRLTAADVLDGPGLVAALAKPVGPWEVVAKYVAQAYPRPEAGADSPGVGPVLDALNALAKTTDLLTAKELADARAHPRFVKETEAFGPKPKDWFDLETRRGNRVLYHLLAPQLIAAPAPLGQARVRRYVSRGGTLGEIAVSLGIPRSATCVAFSHPGAEGEETNVELVRVPADLLRELLDQSPEIRREFDQSIRQLLEGDEQAASSIQSRSHSHHAEELGLMQGQNLMLIDLERCTRCGDCVEACIDAHDDGYSRLFLDGPRIGKYLVPSSCRLCRDPVCMIGCPVGSIQQGDRGQILIRDWCIGCGLCADQCPYDSIQMHDLSIVPAGRPGWKWQASRGVPTPDEWTTAAYADREWASASAPFRLGFAKSVTPSSEGNGAAATGSSYFFRHHFFLADGAGEARPARLTITAQGGGATAWLDGRPLTLTQDAKQAKKGEFEATVPVAALTPGPHLLAATANVPDSREAVIFDACLERLPPEHEDVEVKLVSQQAVVCDQCATLSGGRSACVYACPHEAALRVDAWTQLPVG